MSSGSSVTVALDGHGAEGQVVDEVAVHDIEMDRVDATACRPHDFIAKLAEVGVEDAAVPS